MLLSRKAKTKASFKFALNAAPSNMTFVNECKDQEIQPTNAQLCQFVINSTNALPKLTASAAFRDFQVDLWCAM